MIVGRILIKTADGGFFEFTEAAIKFEGDWLHVREGKMANGGHEPPMSFGAGQVVFAVYDIQPQQMGAVAVGGHRDSLTKQLR